MDDHEEFLNWVRTSLYDAELALHNGDATLRRGLWSRTEPVSVLGAWRNAIGAEQVDELFGYLATSFSDCTSYVFELQAYDVVGDMAYTAGLEHTRAYASECERVIATDMSPRMLERAERALVDLPNVKVGLADAKATGLPAESVDTVVAANLLHVVSNASAVMAEIHRLLRPGGLVVLVDYTGEKVPLNRMLVSGWRFLRRWGPMGEKGAHNLTQAGLEALAREAGFGIRRGRLLTGTAMSAAFVEAVKHADANAV